MELKSLQMFVDLAKTLHFGKTAEKHHVSPSTLSRAIQRLENEVGSILLHRDNRSVILSEAGKQFQQYAEQQLEQWKLLQLSLHKKQTDLKGKLRLYCSVTAAYSHLPPLLERFRQQNPLVEIMLTTGDAADALKQVKQQAVDIAIAAKPEKLERIYSFSHIAQIPLAVIAPKIQCKVKTQIQEKAPWSEIPFILPEHGPARKRFDYWFLKKQQGDANIYATVSGHEALVSMVALGCGIGIAPQVVVENSPVKNRVRFLDNVGEIEPFDLGVYCLNKNKEQSIIKAFFETLSNVGI